MNLQRSQMSVPPTRSHLRGPEGILVALAEQLG